MTPVEMYEELIRLGYVIPVPEHANLMMPTIYRSVPTITTYSTAAVASAPERCKADA